MDEKALFTDFWHNEAKTTRNVLARIPEGSSYRPDPKSRTAKEIAWQIVCEERMIIDALESGKAEWAPPPEPATMKEIVDTYEKQSAAMIERWKKLPAEKWNGALEFFGVQRPASHAATIGATSSAATLGLSCASLTRATPTYASCPTTYSRGGRTRMRSRIDAARLANPAA